MGTLELCWQSLVSGYSYFSSQRTWALGKSELDLSILGNEM